MSDLDEPTLELLLREHLSAELDGQLGRSTEAFLRHVGQAGQASRTDMATASPGAPAADATRFPPMRLADSHVVAPEAPEAASFRFGRRGRLGGAGNFGGRFNGWFFGLAGAALAASIAALWAAPAAFRGGAPAIPVRGVQPVQPDRSNPSLVMVPDTQAPGAGPQVADVGEWGPAHLPPPSPQRPTIHWVQNRAWDEGTVVLDDADGSSDQPGHLIPARKIREQQWDHTQWYDPARRANVEMTVPKQNVKFVEMDTY